MAWVEIEWHLLRIRDNERSGDEPGLHFAIVTVIDGSVNVHGHKTGDLQQLNEAPPSPLLTPVPGREIEPGFWGRIRSQRHVPSARNPFIGLVVRAIEYDNSSADKRNDDYEGFVRQVEAAAQTVVDLGDLPSPEQLWAAGHGVPLDSGFGNDDDRLGVSARADAAWGERIAGALATEAEQPIGTPLGGFRFQLLEFHEEDAWYKLRFNWKMRAGDPGTIPEYVTQQHPGKPAGFP